MSVEYIVKLNGGVLYSPYMEDRLILNPVLTTEINKAGSFEFEVPPENYYYNDFILLNTTIEVFRNDKRIFLGRVLKVQTTFYKLKKVYCEGCLAWFTDFMVAPRTFTGTLQTFLNNLINEYNTLAKEERKFLAGVVGLLKNVNIKIEEYTPLYEVLLDYFVEENGGRLYVDLDEEKPRINFYMLYPFIDQVIQFGKNLLDLNDFIDATDIYTRVIPLGKKDENGNRLKLTPVEYLQNDTLANSFGIITRVIVSDEVDDVNKLRSMGQMYLGKGNKLTITIRVNAVDISYIEADLEAFEVGCSIRVVSPPHEIDEEYIVEKVVLNLQNASNNQYVLGDKTYSLTERLNKAKSNYIVMGE